MSPRTAVPAPRDPRGSAFSFGGGGRRGGGVDRDAILSGLPVYAARAMGVGERGWDG
jgi:hypothetical protein